MYINKLNIYRFFTFIFIFLFLPFDSKSLDEFDYYLLNEKLNRLEQEISDIQKSLYAPENNTTVKDDKKPIS